MKTKHTPGPWKIRINRQGPKVIHETTPGNAVLIAQVCETSTKMDEPDRAVYDAALITAAPELLEALQQLLALHEPTNSLARLRNEYTAARAAIAKATGEAR